MAMEDSPFLVKELVTQKVNLTGALVTYITKTLESNPQEFEKYNLSIQRFQDVLVMVMPIIDTISDEGRIAFRIFMINYGEAIECHIGINHKPYGKNKGYDSVFHLIKGDAFFADAQTIEKKLENKLYFIFGTRKEKTAWWKKVIGGRLGQQAIADQYIEFQIPITKIQKPETFKDLKTSKFFGLANKEYIDKNAISRILYIQEKFAYESYRNNIMAITCLLCCFGIGLLFIPVAAILNKRKQKRSLEYQAKLFFDEASIINPPAEWIAAMEELSK